MDKYLMKIEDHVTNVKLEPFENYQGDRCMGLD